MAIIYYSMGDFTSAREHALYSLDLNQINPYALFVKAMT